MQNTQVKKDLRLEYHKEPWSHQQESKRTLPSLSNTSFTCTCPDLETAQMSVTRRVGAQAAPLWTAAPPLRAVGNAQDEALRVLSEAECSV